MTGILTTWVRRVKTSIDRRVAIDELSRMSDAQLRDIGVERGSIAEVFDGRIGRLEGKQPQKGSTATAPGSRAYA